ncbi:CBS domain-containing protein [Candidatus Avelusimicrobium luingense]|uniref:CBS domain-containing protein n=1 Tax=Candidatus Avelusimicrobium luingense TaxID=3416211 RepID=UPI003D0C0657
MNNPMQALAGAITEKFILAAPQKAAAALETLATHEVLLLISPLKAQVIISVLNVMQPPKAAAVLRRLPMRQASYILARMNVPQAAKLMQEFSVPYRERISAVLEPSFLQVLNGAVSYGEDAVGSLMQTDFVAVRTEIKLAQVIERLKNLPRKKIPALCLVTDKDGTLKGVLRPAELAFYAPSSVAGSVMSTSPSLHPADTLSHAREVFNETGVDALAVVDEKNVAVGILLRWQLPTEDKKTFWQKLTH